MKRFIQLLTFALLFQVISCKAQEAQPLPDLYDIHRMTKVELTFAEKDWQYLLHYYYSRQKGERQLANAVINGMKIDSVGVRFKGFSSYKRSMIKNPLNIKLDHTQKKAQYQQYESLKLSNGNLDPSWLREVLAYQIARKYMVAPQANYAQLFVNGQYHGLYGNTENVDDKFAKRYFHTKGDDVVIKGNSPLGPFSGERSSLQYLGEDTTAYERGYELESKYGWTALKDLIKALKNNAPNLETLLDMDGAIWMLAFNNVLVNLDSYSDFQQNYYLLRDANGQFHFVVWDVNLAFDGLGKLGGIIMQPEYDPLAKIDDERFPLIQLVLKNPTYRKIYFAHCRTILKENFSNGWYKTEGERLRNMIREAVQQDTNWVYKPAAFEQNFQQTYVANVPAPFPYPGITELMEARIRYLENHPEYRKMPPVISDVKGVFNTTDSTEISITASIKNSNKSFVAYRISNHDIFKKIPLFDDGKHNDGAASDGIFGAVITTQNKKLQYYIYAENTQAAMFSPEQAEYIFYSFPEKR